MVYLVGAGPGDPGLLTLRAAELLKQAEVVLYDRLVSPAVLEMSAPEAERVYAGKDRGDSSPRRQARVIDLMIEFARAGKTVVRLKGGDPFVFGRGGEEALALRKEGIACEIIPGISASVAAPAAAGIPVTHRGIASAFGVFAGHEAGTAGTDGKSGIDWDAAARMPTAVFLMGVERLPRIVAALRENGRDAATPVAVVESATRPEQRVVTGTLENIVEAAAHLSPPAAVIVGEVVNLRNDLNGP